jgi:hypothetical protein
MLGIELYNLSGGINFAVLTAEFERWANDMKQNGTLKAAMDDLRSKLEFHRKKAVEIETALRALESVASDDSSSHQTVVMHGKEFANAGIADAAVIMLRRANRALHVKEIAEGLDAGGYEFKAKDPMSSIAPILYMSAKNKKHGIISKGKNTYSLKEIEDKNPVQ